MNKLLISNDKIFLEDEDGNLSLEVSENNKFLNVQSVSIVVNSDTDLVIDSNIFDKKVEICVNILKGVRVNIFELKKGSDYKFQYNYYLEEDSLLNIEKINDVNNILEMTLVNLNGDRACVNYNLKTVSTSLEKYSFLIYHNASRTISNINNNGVNILDGLLEFNVSSFIPNGIKKCEASQGARIINNTDNECVIKPNLFIDEEDVIANHSAVIGTFSFDEMFYLMSRGISKNESEMLLIKGFLMKNISFYKEELSDIIEKYWG